MKYDLSALEITVKERKIKFITLISILLIASIVCVALMAFSKSGEVIIISGAALLVLFFISRRLFDKFNPKVLFSKEITGENLKEGEYEIMKRGSASTQGMRYRQVGSSSIGTRSGAAPIAPSTGANRKAFHKNMHFSGEVYLKTDDGNVVLISGLYGSHLEIYEEGDILLKPAGAKFPIVVSRDAERQPCPLCGEVNGGERECCGACGLKILK